jgi:hypothetical protein
VLVLAAIHGVSVLLAETGLRCRPSGLGGGSGNRRSAGDQTDSTCTASLSRSDLDVVPFEEDDESPFVGLLQIVAA